MNHHPFFDSIDLSTRRKRRAATKLASYLIGIIHHAEYQYLERIPPNLQGSAAYEAADETLDLLVEAINVLDSAFD